MWTREGVRWKGWELKVEARMSEVERMGIEGGGIEGGGEKEYGGEGGN